MPGRERGHGGDRTHNNKHTNDRETQISKALSLVLRHRAKDLGLAMDERGFVKVDELLRHQRFRSLKLSLSELRGIVDSNAKQRFELLVLPLDTTTVASTAESSLDNPANYLIRASQGHSIKGLDAEALLTPILSTDEDFPAEVVHGTYASSWPAILASGGLKPMGRVHVHFAMRVPGESSTVGASSKVEEEEGKEEVSVVPGVPPVVSGMRASAGLLVWVDVRRASESGVKWWRSRNGVVLTEGVVVEGEKEGLVSLEFVSRVVERRGGKVVWKNEWWDEGASV